MNPAYRDVIAASQEERADLFATTAARLGTPVQNVEKDFWVCWTLDALFNGLPQGSPRLLFKGGTSLSKAFSHIPRFSEDIDITVFREDIGQTVDPVALEVLSGKQRRKKLDEIREACCAYIQGPLLEHLRQCAAAEIGSDQFSLEIDLEEPDGQTILFWYPVATRRGNDYIRSAVKIEAGAKSALDPHTLATVTPYVNDDLAAHDLSVHNITTVEAERTFWDKMVILHGLRQWYETRGELRHGGQRVSRHYYDVYQLMQGPAAEQWLSNHQLALDCARHARLFFGSPALGLETAVHGSFTLSPSPTMIEALKKDYFAMAGMIFGAAPDFDAVLRQVSDIERMLNRPGAGEHGGPK